MGPEELPRVIFPLGDAPSKSWVRSEAERMGLGVSNKPDSYDICFIPDGDTQGFLRSHLGSNPGDIVDTEGHVVGRHDGYWNFTVGQRRGLNLGNPAADGRPRYVVETKPQLNQVVVGASELLSVDHIDCSELVWLAPDDSGEINEGATREFGPSLGQRCLNEVDEGVVTAQIRAHGVPSVVTELVRENDEDGSSRLSVALAQPIRGVAAGQSLVLYRGTRVIAEATIERAYRG